MANISCILIKGQASSAVSNNYTEMRERLDNLLEQQLLTMTGNYGELGMEWKVQLFVVATIRLLLRKKLGNYFDIFDITGD